MFSNTQVRHSCHSASPEFQCSRAQWRHLNVACPKPFLRRRSAAKTSDITGISMRCNSSTFQSQTKLHLDDVISYLSYLSLFSLFVHTCHGWRRSHPQIPPEAVACLMRCWNFSRPFTCRTWFGEDGLNGSKKGANLHHLHRKPWALKKAWKNLNIEGFMERFPSANSTIALLQTKPVGVALPSNDHQECPSGAEFDLARGVPGVRFCACSFWGIMA